MTIVDLHQNPLDSWLPQLLDNYRFLPYWWLRRVTPESQRTLMQRALKETLDSPKTDLVGYVQDDALLGFAQMHWLEWDSNHFDVNVFRLNYLGVWGENAERYPRAVELAQAILHRARERNADTVQTWIPMDDIVVIHALEQVGFRLMDIRVTWIFDLSRTPIPDYQLKDGVVVRDHQPADEKALAALAGSAYVQLPSRFHSDPHLPDQACNELYRQWMLNSINSDLADHIAVVQVDGRVVCYASQKYLGDLDGACNIRLAQLLLGATAPEMRRRGLVTQAIIRNLRWAADKTDIVFVGTMVNNISPQIVWHKMGFRPALSGASLHIWLETPK